MFLMPWAAILIGCCAAAVSVLGYLYITVSTISIDVCSVHVCVCVRACVRAYVRACMCVCVYQLKTSFSGK